MRIFILFDLVVIAAALWLIANLLRYAARRVMGSGGEDGNPLFRLSDKWLDADKQKRGKRNG